MTTPHNLTETPEACVGSAMKPRRVTPRKMSFFLAIVAVLPLIAFCGCSQVLGIGKFKGIEKTAADEHYYLVKSPFLSGGSQAHPREDFDHKLQDNVVLSFTVPNEKHYYVTKSKWLDPSGHEFRTIRQTHDKKKENDQAEDRPKGGSRRFHSIPTKTLADHKTGLWTVELFIDDQLARRLTFTVR